MTYSFTNDSRSTARPDPQANQVAQSLTALEATVRQWMVSPAGCDQRKHPSILQFLTDAREHVASLDCGAHPSLRPLVLALERLSRKIRDPRVDTCIQDFLTALDARWPEGPTPTHRKDA